MIKLLVLILFARLSVTAIRLTIRAAWGLTKLAAICLFVTALFVLIGCLFRSGFFLLLPLLPLLAACGILKACVRI